MVNLEHLYQFTIVVEHMNFTKAAEYLFISHSTISRNIASLESELGVQLFVRNNRSMSLTNSGRVLAERAKRLLGDVIEMKAATKRAAQDLGFLDVTTFNFYSPKVFGAFRRFSEQWPEYDLTIRHKPLDEIFSLVSSRATDIGIIFDYALEGDMSDYILHPVLEGEFCAVVPDVHPLAGMTAVDANDPRLTTTLTLGELEFDFVRKIGAESNSLSSCILTPNTPITLDSLILQIKSGKGIALLPEHVATEVMGSCSILKLLGVNSRYKIVLCWRKQNSNPAIPLFLDYLTE